MNDILKAKAMSLKCDSIINYKIETLKIFLRESVFHVIISVSGDAVVMEPTDK